MVDLILRESYPLMKACYSHLQSRSSNYPTVTFDLLYTHCLSHLKFDKVSFEGSYYRKLVPDHNQVKRIDFIELFVRLARCIKE